MVSYFDIEHRRVHCVPTCKGIQSRWQNKGASIRFQLSHYPRRLPFPRLGVHVRPQAVPATAVCGGRRRHMGPQVSEWRLVCRISFISCYIFRVRYLFYVDPTLVECPQGYSECAHRSRRGGFPHTLTSFLFRRLFKMFNCPFNRDHSGKCPMGARRDYRQQHPWVSCKVTTTAPPSCWSLLPRRWAIARCGFPLVAGLFLTDRLGQFSINEGVSLFGGGVHSGR